MQKRHLLTAVAAAGGLAVAVAALRTKKNIWALAYGKDGFAVALTEVPLWAEVAEDMLDVLPCIHPARDWSYRIGLRRFGVFDDDSNDPIYNLGNLAMAVCDLRHSITFKAERNVASIPIARETALKINEHWATQCEALMGDDEDEDEDVFEDDEGGVDPVAVAIGLIHGKPEGQVPAG